MNCEQIAALSEIALLLKYGAIFTWIGGGLSLLAIILTMRP